MKTIIADIFEEFEKTDRAVLIHQANCQKVMGAGIARIIKKGYPDAYKADRESTSTLGHYSSSAEGIGRFIVNLYGQEKCTGNSLGDRDTSYDAVYDSLKKVFADIENMPMPMTIYIPYGMSSNLAGARWPIIEKMIEVLGEGLDIIICRLPSQVDLK